MNKKYIVRLTEKERGTLTDMVGKGKAAAYKIKHANILLKADANTDGPDWSDACIADAFSCHTSTVVNVRRRFVEQGLEAALLRKKREQPPRERILDGEAEARLVQIACSQPPEGRAKWTLNLLADKLVELEIVGGVSPQTVMRTLKKTSSSRTYAPVG
jgi:transposase